MLKIGFVMPIDQDRSLRTAMKTVECAVKVAKGEMKVSEEAVQVVAETTKPVNPIWDPRKWSR